MFKNLEFLQSSSVLLSVNTSKAFYATTPFCWLISMEGSKPLKRLALHSLSLSLNSVRNHYDSKYIYIYIYLILFKIPTSEIAYIKLHFLKECYCYKVRCSSGTHQSSSSKCYGQRWIFWESFSSFLAKFTPHLPENYDFQSFFNKHPRTSRQCEMGQYVCLQRNSTFKSCIPNERCFYLALFSNAEPFCTQHTPSQTSS